MTTHASLVLVNGVVHTLDQAASRHSAVAVVNDRIVAVGDHATVSPCIGPGTTVIDLEGRSVLPGFIDAHTHWEVTSYIRNLWIDATLESPRRVLEILQDEVARRSPGEWIVIAGGFLSPLPSLETLDALAPQHPVIIRRTMHVQVANSLAFSLSGLSASNPQPMPGCRLELDASGRFTGMVEDAFDLFAVPQADEATLEHALRSVADELFLANGITTIHDMPASRHGTRTLQKLHRDGGLPVRVVLYPILPPVHRSGPDLDVYTDVAIQSGLGDDWFRFGGVKLFVDGHERGAAHSDDMAAGPERHRLPLFGRTFEQLVALLTQSMAGGIQVRMHAWGGYAQRQALDAVRIAARATDSPEHRTRMEHMLNARYDEIPMTDIVSSGVVPVPQASFMVNDEPSDVRAKYAFRDALDAGVVVANSSDCTGSQPTLVSPWVGIASMVARENRRGEVIDQDQAVSLTEALRSYTLGSAYAAFEEDDKGSIEVGKLADFAVVDHDPYELAPSALSSMGTHTTIIGGRIVYRRADGGDQVRSMSPPADRV